MFSKSIHSAVSATGVGFIASVSARVDTGFKFVAKNTSTALEFRVYDRTNTTLLGSLSQRSFAQWTDELNGKGLGRITARLSDPTLRANPELLDDDNVIRAHYRGVDRFAWRVKSGEDDLINSSEYAGETAGLDGPGGLDVLEEGIVRPEYPITGDPTRTASDRFFGYMSKKEASSYHDSSTVTNLITAPKVTLSTDWAILAGGTAGTTSVGVAAGNGGYNSFRFTYTSSGTTSVTARLASAAYIPVVPGQKVSAGAWVKSSLGGKAGIVAYFDTGILYGTEITLVAGEPTNIDFESITVPAAASVLQQLAVVLPDLTHIDTNVVDIFWPVVNTGETLIEYFDGDFANSLGYVYDWTGLTNSSTSTRVIRKIVQDNLQPSWYVPSLWAAPYESVRKSAITKGTAANAPDGWADPTAFVIWPNSPQTPSTPGTVYWRREFYNPERTGVFLQAAADNQLRVWLDGVEVITQGFNGDATDITGSWDGVLEAGTHLIAAETTNFKSFNPGENYGWFICSVMKKINNQPLGVISHTDTTWECFYEGDANVPFVDTVSSTITYQPTSTQTSVPVTYTVRPGDTLSAIGSKFGVAWRDIYNANKRQIDDRAARSGLAYRGVGWWIWPGQVFDIPGRYTTTSVSAQVPVTVLTTERVWSAGTALSTKQPGWYPYQILAQLVTEAKARGVAALANVTLGFNFGFDSDGVEWATGFDSIVDKSFRIGDSLYEATQELIDGGLDVRMSPDFTLNAYRRLGEYRGISTRKANQFLLWDKGGSTLEYKITRRSELRNSLLINTDQGWTDYTNISSDQQGRAEASASLGGINAGKILQAIGAELEELGKRTKVVTTKFVVMLGRIPYEDFDLGDIVVARDNLGRKFDARIVALSISESEGLLTCEIQASGEGLQ